MANIIADMSLRKAALIAGLAYLIIFVVGVPATMWESLVAHGDAATTASNFIANEFLLRISIVSWLVVLVADLVVAWALYIFLKPVNKSLSLLAAGFRLVFVAIFGVTLLNLFMVLQLSSGSDYLSAFGTGQLQAQMMLFLSAFDFGVQISWVFFGLHIFLLGYLIIKSSYIPRILGVLLIIASIGYQINSFANFLIPNIANYEQTLFIVTVAVPAIISELLLTLWLLLKGRKIPEMKL